MADAIVLETSQTGALGRQWLASRLGAAALYSVGAIAALASAYHANAGYSILPLKWLVWIAGPYVLLGLTGDAIGRRPGSRGRNRALVAASVAALAFTVLAYWGIWRGPHHSTEGLVFIFAPLWIVAFVFIVFAVVWSLWRITTGGSSVKNRLD